MEGIKQQRFIRLSKPLYHTFWNIVQGKIAINIKISVLWKSAKKRSLNKIFIFKKVNEKGVDLILTLLI